MQDYLLMENMDVLDNHQHPPPHFQAQLVKPIENLRGISFESNHKNIRAEPIPKTKGQIMIRKSHNYKNVEILKEDKN